LSSDSCPIGILDIAIVSTYGLISFCPDLLFLLLALF
jgi:hypothetical protein